jgi:hypothetical protein
LEQNPACTEAKIGFVFGGAGSLDDQLFGMGKAIDHSREPLREK